MMTDRNLRIVNGCLMAALAVAFFHQIALRQQIDRMERRGYTGQRFDSSRMQTQFEMMLGNEIRARNMLQREVQKLRDENAALRTQLGQQRAEEETARLMTRPLEATSPAIAALQKDNRPARPTIMPMPQIPPRFGRLWDTFPAECQAHFQVGSEGRVTVELPQGTGNAEVDSLLLGTLRRWRWQPALRNGKPVEVSARVILQLDHEKMSVRIKSLVSGNPPASVMQQMGSR